jgi:hypothetical protein
MWSPFAFESSWKRNRMITHCSYSIQQWKISTYRAVSIFRDRCFLEARARMPSPGIWKVHSIRFFRTHESVLESQWTWLRPLLMDHFICYGGCHW